MSGIRWLRCTRRWAPSATFGKSISGRRSRSPESAVPIANNGDDHRASVLVQRAALLLRAGDDVGDVAVATEVPVALLELLRAEVADEADLNRQRRDTIRTTRRRRRIVRAVVVMEVAAVANVVVGLTALIGHVAGLGLLATVIAAALLLAVSALAKYATSTGSRSPSPAWVVGRERHGPETRA